MKTTTSKPAVFFGVQMGSPITSIDLNQRELATLRRAAEIREQVRDRIEGLMGPAGFESSRWYCLRIDDLLDEDGAVLTAIEYAG